jgi:hypothetical protein
LAPEPPIAALAPIRPIPLDERKFREVSSATGRTLKSSAIGLIMHLS